MRRVIGKKETIGVGSMSLGIFYNQYYFSGSALTFSATSGRIAGADAAQAD